MLLFFHGLFQSLMVVCTFWRLAVLIEYYVNKEEDAQKLIGI